VFQKCILPAALCLLLTACGPDPADLQLRVDAIEKSLQRQVLPSDATLIRGIRYCELIIEQTNNGHTLIKSQSALGAQGQAEIYHCRHQAAVFLVNLAPEKQGAVAAANPQAFPNYDPAHPETAFEYLQDGGQ
jgi:hypothetical protein